MTTLFKQFIFLIVFSNSVTFAQTNYIPVKGSAWRLAVADVTGDQRKELIYGTFEGAIRCQSLTSGDLLWEVPIHAFPFSVVAKDINYDGKAEIFVAAANGKLYAISSRGHVLWTFASKFPLYAVAVGDIEPGGTPEIVTGGIDRQVYVLSSLGKLMAQFEVSRLVHHLATVDVDQDGRDEVFVVNARAFANLLTLNPSQVGTWKGVPYPYTVHAWQGIPYPNLPINVKELWQTPMLVSENEINWENPKNRFHGFSVTIDNINDDSDFEILLGGSLWNQQAVMALSATTGKRLWISPKQPPFFGKEYTEFYSTAFVQTTDIEPNSLGKEILTIAGGMVRLLSNKGQVLKQAHAQIGFTDLVVDDNSLYLGSSPNGDTTVYRVDMRQDWVNQIEHLERQGKIQQIGETLANIRQQVENYQGTATHSTQIYDIRLKQKKLKPNATAYQDALRKITWFNEQFPYYNLRAVFMMKLMEEQPPLDETGQPWSEERWQADAVHGTMSVDEILDIARQIETHRIPTVFMIGHSCMPFIHLQTAEKILHVAPRYTVGFVSMEDNCLDRLSRYIQHYFGPLADICVRYGHKKCIALNKNAWWMAAPAIKDIYTALFQGQRGKALVAASEDSNSRTPEINVLARSGLWLAGLIDTIQVSAISDLFSFSRYHEWEYPKHGHPYLRLLIAHTVLGGNTFGIRIMDMQPTGDTWTFSRLGQESTEIFYHMLGKGIVFAPTREQVKGFSPVGIAVHEPPEKWLQDSFNNHSPWNWQEDETLHNAVFPHNGCLWGNTQTPEHALQKLLLGTQRQFGAHIPATPYGLIAIVPAHADLENVPGIKTWWHTDGIYVWQDEKQKLTGREAGCALKTAFEQAATQLPFRTQEAVFLQTLKIDDNTYRLFIIDPGWLTPETRHVSIQVQMGQPVFVTDVLSNEKIAVADNQIHLTVPAGAFRILEVVTRCK